MVRASVTAGYFAFVRRDQSRRYIATLPDFPGCHVESERLSDLAESIRALMNERAETAGWPASTRLEQLPRQAQDHDGYWLMVEVEPPV